MWAWRWLMLNYSESLKVQFLYKGCLLLPNLWPFYSCNHNFLSRFQCSIIGMNAASLMVYLTCTLGSAFPISYSTLGIDVYISLSLKIQRIRISGHNIISFGFLCRVNQFEVLLFLPLLKKIVMPLQNMKSVNWHTSPSFLNFLLWPFSKKSVKTFDRSF